MNEFTEDEIAANRRYEQTILAAIDHLMDGMMRGTSLLAEWRTGNGDADLYEHIRAEFRSWRPLLHDIPDDPSPLFRGLHARVLRWGATIATVGDIQAAAIETGDEEGFRRAAHGTRNCPPSTTGSPRRWGSSSRRSTGIKPRGPGEPAVRHVT